MALVVVVKELCFSLFGVDKPSVVWTPHLSGGNSGSNTMK